MIECRNSKCRKKLATPLFTNFCNSIVQFVQPTYLNTQEIYLNFKWIQKNFWTSQLETKILVMFRGLNRYLMLSRIYLHICMCELKCFYTSRKLCFFQVSAKFHLFNYDWWFKVISKILSILSLFSNSASISSRSDFDLIWKLLCETLKMQLIYLFYCYFMTQVSSWWSCFKKNRWRCSWIPYCFTGSKVSGITNEVSSWRL